MAGYLNYHHLLDVLSPAVVPLPRPVYSYSEERKYNMLQNTKGCLLMYNFLYDLSHCLKLTAQATGT